MILEAYRECLQDVFDVPGLVALAGAIRRREVKVVTVDTETPSPFAASLLFGYAANYIYEGDAPLAERRAQALSVDQRQLQELLGEAELRELLDPGVIESVEAALQALDPRMHARSPDRLHDLLLRLGDLTPGEIALRVSPPAKGDSSAALPETLAEEWTDALVRERRAVRVRLGDEERIAAAEDAGRLRDAFGVPPPLGLPQAFLEAAPLAMPEWVARFARTHAPFSAAELARRYRVTESAVEAELQALAADGRVLEGSFRPEGRGREWCDVDVLAQLRRRSLARLRRQVEPADPAALARLLVDWHGVAPAQVAVRRGGPDVLLEVVEQLQGASLPASVLEADVLLARLPGYRSEHLDTLCAAGEVVWVGQGPLGERDGKVALFLAEDLPLLHAPSAEPPEGEVHQAIRDHLARHGASFFADLVDALPGTLEKTVLDALWDLVFAGEVTNDSPAALRAFLRPPRHAARRSRLSGFRSRRPTPPSAVGRWSRVPRPGPKVTPTLRAKALAEQLLARHGLLTRTAVQAEAVAGGFSALYPVLKALEDAGRVRRGYFVSGLGGSQFAHPGALERLRVLRDTAADPEDDTLPAVVLAATDPANPYGAALPWPAEGDARAQRAAGAHVVLADGALAAFLGRGGKEIAAWLPADEPGRGRVGSAVAAALFAWAVRTGRSTFTWGDGAGGLAPFLREAGFTPWGPGWRLAAVAPPAVPLREPRDLAEG
jgi:ATP-dependent Lhr-like helicase